MDETNHILSQLGPDLSTLRTAEPGLNMQIGAWIFHVTRKKRAHLALETTKPYDKIIMQHRNRNQTSRANMGECMPSGSIVDADYC